MRSLTGHKSSIVTHQHFARSPLEVALTLLKGETQAYTNLEIAFEATLTVPVVHVRKEAQQQ